MMLFLVRMYRSLTHLPLPIVLKRLESWIIKDSSSKTTVILDSLVKALTEMRLNLKQGTYKVLYRIRSLLNLISPIKFTGITVRLGRVTLELCSILKVVKRVLSLQMCLVAPESIIQDSEIKSEVRVELTKPYKPVWNEVMLTSPEVPGMP